MKTVQTELTVIDATPAKAENDLKIDLSPEEVKKLIKSWLNKHDKGATDSEHSERKAEV